MVPSLHTVPTHMMSGMRSSPRPIHRATYFDRKVVVTRAATTEPAGPQSVSRRFVAVALPASLLTLWSVEAAHAAGGEERGINRYIRKKKLEPLETYVPRVLAARSQLDLTKEVRQRDSGLARDMLRTGAFYNLRDSFKAIGEYAVTNGVDKNGNKLVDDFFLKLQAYDRMLTVAAKDQERAAAEKDEEKDPEKVEKAAKEAAEKAAEAEKEQAEKLDSTLKALDALLATVPEDVMAISQVMLKESVEAESNMSTPATAKDIDVDDALLEKMFS